MDWLMILENFTSPFGMPIIIMSTCATSSYLERVFHIHLYPSIQLSVSTWSLLHVNPIERPKLTTLNTNYAASTLPAYGKEV